MLPLSAPKKLLSVLIITISAVKFEGGKRALQLTLVVYQEVQPEVKNCTSKLADTTSVMLVLRTVCFRKYLESTSGQRVP